MRKTLLCSHVVFAYTNTMKSHSLTHIRTVLNYFGQVITVADCAACGTTVKANLKDAAKRQYRCSVQQADKKAQDASYNGFNKGCTCALCERTFLSTAAMTVHHKDGNHNNNNHSNLVGVCAGCHMDLEYIVEKLKAGMNEYATTYETFKAKGFFSEQYEQTAARVNK